MFEKKLSFMKNILLLFLSIAFTSASAQTPCVSGMAGTYPCNGFDLLSFTPCTAFGAQNSNDSWGWTDPVDGIEYALLGLDNGVAFIDISDPVNPLYLGKLPTHTDSSLWRDVKVYNNYAFVVSEAGGHGMQIFDLTRLRAVSNPPEIFTEDAHYNGFGSAHNLVINEQEGYAYGVGTSSYSGGPHFVNIQDPLNPIAAGGYSMGAYSHDGQVITYTGPDSDYTGREIYIGSNTSEVVIVDITNKANPQGISTISYSNTSYTHQGWFSEDQAYFLLGDEIDEIDYGFNTRTVVFDLTDLDNPQFSFEYSGPTPATDHNGYVKGDSFYLANYTAGLRVIDISDISNGNMVETGYFDVFTSNNNAGYNGAWNVYPYFDSGNIMISSLVFSDPTYVPGVYFIKATALGVNDSELAESFSIFPNPASTELNVNASNQTIDSVVITDVMGKTLVNYINVNSESLKLDISAYAKGLYFIKINNNILKKIIKN
jgi:choice-of-anchor B domain-containing protein